MKKNFTCFIIAFYVCVFASAQTFKTQGVPRKVNKAALLQNSPATVSCTVNFDSIHRWVGTGDNQSALVIKWDDGKDGNKNLVWGYRWSSPSQGTGEAMLRAIALADPNFYMLLNGATQYGAAIGGLGYDLNGNGIDHINKGNSICSLINGVYNTNLYDFDSFTSADASDHWLSGWYNGYWSYWTADSTGGDYGYSGVGASSRTLSDGSIDGWSYMSDMTNWYSNDMTGTLRYLPSITLRNATATKKMKISSVTNKKTMVNDLDGFWNAVESAEAGDTIYFYAGMRGTVLEVPTSLSDKYLFNKSLTIIGNGVTIKGGMGWNLEGAGNFIMKDITFSSMTSKFYVHATNLTMSRCAIINTSLAKDIFGFIYDNTDQTFKLSMSNCRFSNNTITKAKDFSIISLWTNADAPTVNADIISCTFTDCTQNAKRGIIGVTNSANVNLCNNVLAGNKISSSYPYSVWTNNTNNTYTSKGYNVIEGNVVDSIKHVISTDVNKVKLDSVLKYDDGEYKVLPTGDAYQHMPANPSIDGVTLPTEDIQGLKIDYTKPTHSGASQLVYTVPSDYSNGTFIVNEDWYGHQNSTVNFLTKDGEWIYRVVQKENPGVELGATNQYGAIYGGKFYLIAKQAKDPGATITGGRITVCNAKTMKVLKQHEFIATNEDGTSACDGRGFLGVDENKGYVGSSNGIYILDLNSLDVTGSVKGTGSGATTSYGQLYGGQIGNMVRVNDKVFAVHQKNGLLVIDAKADTVIRTISGPNGWQFGSVVLSKDGSLWLSIANSTGSGEAGNFMIKLNPSTLDTTQIIMPTGIYGPANSWYAWTPDGFCASTQHNILYWNGGANSWFSNKTIYKYDIDNNTFGTFIDLSNEDWMLYGCSFRIDPVTDDAYISLFKGFQDPTYVLRKYSDDGTKLSEYSMINNYWFPSLPVFPDTKAPIVNTLASVTHSTNKSFTISLKELATDADNMDAAIVKTVKKITDLTILNAEMKNGDLVVTPLKDGTTDITIQVNSNGKLAETDLSVIITGITGVKDASPASVRSAFASQGNLCITNCGGYHFALYNMIGEQMTQFECDSNDYTQSLNIKSDGTYILRGINGDNKVIFKIFVRK